VTSALYTDNFAGINTPFGYKKIMAKLFKLIDIELQIK